MNGVRGFQLQQSHQLLRMVVSVALVCLSFMGVHAVSHAMSIESSEVWVDPTAHASWPQVQQQAFKPISLPISRGYTQEVTWLKLRLIPSNQIAASATNNEPMVLRVRPPFLDHVTLYDPAQSEPITQGDVHPKLTHGYQSLNINFLLPSSVEPREVYLRLQTTSSSLLDVSLLTLTQAMQADRLQDLVFSAYIALLLMFVLWGGLQWWLSRDTLFAWFTFYELSLLAWTVSVFGYVSYALPSSWPNEWPSHAVSFTAVMVVAVSDFFHLRLTRTFNPSPNGWRAAHVVLMFPIFSLLSWAFGNTLLAMQANVFGVLVTPFVFFALALNSMFRNRGPKQTLEQKQSPLSAKHFVWVYGTIASLMLVYSLALMGMQANANMALYGALTHAGLVGVVVLVTMQIRANRLARMAKQTEKQLERQQVLLELERDQRKDQESLLAMLAHEMKTPMSTVKMLLLPSTPHQNEIKAAIDDMNNVIDRCVLSAKLTDQKIKVEKQLFAIEPMVRSLAERHGITDRLKWSAQGANDVMGDPQLMHFVLNNLLENAKKYSAPNSLIEVTLLSPDRSELQRAGVSITSLPSDLASEIVKAQKARQKHSTDAIEEVLDAAAMSTLPSVEVGDLIEEQCDRDDNDNCRIPLPIQISQNP